MNFVEDCKIHGYRSFFVSLSIERNRFCAIPMETNRYVFGYDNQHIEKQ